MARESARNKARQSADKVKTDDAGATVADTLTSDNERAGVKPVEADEHGHVHAEDRETDLKVYSHTGLDDPNYDHVDPRTDAEVEADRKSKSSK